MQSTQLPDSMLIDRFRAGDARAMDALVTRHTPRVYAHALKLSHDHEIAADVVANTLARVHRSAVNFKGNSAFGTWLHTLTKNCFLDLHRKISSRPVESLSQGAGPDHETLERQLPSREPSPHDLAERSARQQILARAVNALPDRQRALILMFHDEMLSYEEIADQLHVPIGTVKSRLFRARQELQADLNRDRYLLGIGKRDSIRSV